MIVLLQKMRHSHAILSKNADPLDSCRRRPLLPREAYRLTIISCVSLSVYIVTDILQACTPLELSPSICVECHTAIENMLPLFKSKPRYATVNNCEQAELKLGGEEDASAQYLTLRMGFCSALVVAALLLSSIASTWVLLFSSIFQHQARSPTTTLDPILAITPTSSAWVCQSPAARREWRTLSDTEREEYVEAVRCLATKPSKLRNTGTLYDDFPWVHKRLSGKSVLSSTFYACVSHS